MPTYEYLCTECATPLEVVQAFNDQALTECPECSGRLRKVYSNVGVVFKGSGFYRTDSREAKKASSTPVAKPAAASADSATPAAKTSTAESANKSSSTPPSDSAAKSSKPATTPASAK